MLYGRPRSFSARVEVSGGERGAHRRARHSNPALRNHGQDLDFAAVPLAEALQQRDIAGALRAEAEVLADEHPAGLQPLNEHPLDERFRRQRGEIPVEALDVRALHPVRRQQLELLAKRREPRGRAIGREELARMRLEGEHAALQAPRARAGEEALQHRLVPAMDAVEIPHGERNRRQQRGGGAVGQQHERRKMA